MQPPRQASPPGADVRQSQQCICTSHLPLHRRGISGAVLFQQPYDGYAKRQPSVSVLDISPPQENGSAPTSGIVCSPLRGIIWGLVI